MICASLTWLRNHKSTGQEAALLRATDAYKDEPAWLVEQLLRRKRDELLKRWEDRERCLEAARLKEKAREERGRKRRRIEDLSTTRQRPEDEDAEWLLDDPDDRGTQSDNALSGLSKESREALEKIGLGAPRKQPDADQDIMQEDIKVRDSMIAWAPTVIVTLVDLLYFKNPLPALSIYQRASAANFPNFFAIIISPGTECVVHRASEARSSIIPAKALHKPVGISPRICTGHKRSMRGASKAQIRQ